MACQYTKDRCKQCCFYHKNDVKVGTIVAADTVSLSSLSRWMWNEAVIWGWGIVQHGVSELPSPSSSPSRASGHLKTDFSWQKTNLWEFALCLDTWGRCLLLSFHSWSHMEGNASVSSRSPSLFSRQLPLWFCCFSPEWPWHFIQRVQSKGEREKQDTGHWWVD